MRPRRILLSGIMMTAVLCSCRSGLHVDDSTLTVAFGERRGAFVLIDCASGAVSEYGKTPSSEKLPPCSTFKIWNTLAGLEYGILSSPDEAFYKWDGEKRAIPGGTRI